MLTVAQLRKMGYQVEVRHSRNVDIVNGEAVVSPLGGETHVKITTPNGKELEGHAVCSVKDNYCKREGVRYCIERAFTSYFLPKTKKGKKSGV